MAELFQISLVPIISISFLNNPFIYSSSIVKLNIFLFFLLLCWLAAQYANLQLLLPYLYPGNKRYINGINFASGGAGALDEINRGLVILSFFVHFHFYKICYFLLH